MPRNSVSKGLLLILALWSFFLFDGFATAQERPKVNFVAGMNVGGRSSINSAYLSADGKFLVTAHHEKATLWDVATGRAIRDFGHAGSVSSIAGTGKWLVTAAGDTAKLWNTETGAEIRTFQGENVKSVNSVAMSDDGKLLVTGGWDSDAQGQIDVMNLLGSARLWDVATGKEIRNFGTQNAVVTSVAMSKDGKRLIIGVGKEAHLFDVESGKMLRSFVGHNQKLLTLALSGDGKRLVTASGTKAVQLSPVPVARDVSVRLWEVDTGKEVRKIAPLDGHNVVSVALSADGKWMVTGSEDRTARLWEFESGKALKVFEAIRPSFVYAVAISGDGKLVITCGHDGQSHLWENKKK